MTSETSDVVDDESSDFWEFILCLTLKLFS